MDEAMRRYQATSTLPDPEEFGMGTQAGADANADANDRRSIRRFSADL